MRQAKLLVAFVLTFASLWVLLPVATGQSKTTTKKSGTSKGTTKKGGGSSTALGAKAFQGTCTACHPGGNNTIEPEKTLKLDALKKFGFNGPEDIKKRIREGAGVMPAFEGDITPKQIDAIAAYVWAQAQKDWKK